MKLARVSLVILVGIETFCDESAAIEMSLRLPSHECTWRAVWLLSAKVDIEPHFFCSLFHSFTAWYGCVVVFGASPSL